MAILSDLMYNTSITQTIGMVNVEVAEIVFDSRLASPAAVFVATKGSTVDGHAYIDKAIELGCRAIVCEDWPETLTEGVTYLQVNDSARALGIMAANLYGNPSNQLTVVAVTGTNGKTTTATLLFKLFRAMGYSSGLVSTVQNQINEQVIPSTHTTPDAVQLQRLLAQMLKAGCTHVFMEASSHAIHQQRIAGLVLAGAVFTNITHDHLDYHVTFDNYIRAKKQLFDQLPASAFALVNADDKRGMVMLQNTKGKKLSYGLQGHATYKGRLLADGLHGLQLDLDGHEVWFKLIGKFNAYNLLAVYGVAIQLGEEPENILAHLSSLESAPGRFDRILTTNEVTYIVDYAHTPDALQNVLQTITDLRTQNEHVITVIGCGGNRDAAKRPIMAEVAVKQSNIVILTSDNPRNEDPEAILDDMQKGVSPSNFRKVKRIPDRQEAIQKAVALAQPGDIVLIAGKGHENYQEIAGVKHPFDDKLVLQAALKDAGVGIL
jgi:UDP-N-acetylmuramoyl-L-alanyl-D-glutamate--2,6-diaminopimelate ligase